MKSEVLAAAAENEQFGALRARRFQTPVSRLQQAQPYGDKQSLRRAVRDISAYSRFDMLTCSHLDIRCAFDMSLRDEKTPACAYWVVVSGQSEQWVNWFVVSNSGNVTLTDVLT